MKSWSQLLNLEDVNSAKQRRLPQRYDAKYAEKIKSIMSGWRKNIHYERQL